MILEGNKASLEKESKKICIDLLGQEFKDKINRNICSDIAFLGKNNNKSIGVSDIREIQNDIFVKPVECNFKIYVFQNAQNLTEQAQNALLKILEDPPNHAVFLLLCENSNKLIPTIVSRSRLIILKKYSEIEENINPDCEDFIKYLIKNEVIMALSIGYKHNKDKEKFKIFIENCKKIIINKISNGETNYKFIDYCEKINKCLYYIDKNLNKQLALISIFI